MSPVLTYLLKSAVSIAILYIVYHLSLSRDTMYGRNRIFILASLAGALIMPLIVIETRIPHDIQFFGKDLTAIYLPGVEVNAEPAGLFKNLNWQVLLKYIYLTGLFIAFSRLLAELGSLLHITIRNKGNRSGIITISGIRTSGFSAFGKIYISNTLDQSEAEEIIKHEQRHLESYHFFDILAIEILKVVQWFNPFIYLFDRSLRAVHEFQADEECLSSGIPVRSYQGLVMNQVFRSRIFNASNSFSNPTLIKKRMIMMTKKRSRSLANLKILIVLPVLALLLMFFSTCSEKISTNETVVTEVTPPSTAPAISMDPNEPFVVVEEMPLFPGGDTALLQYIASNTKYPGEAVKNNITGRVIVRFCITATGSIDRVSVIRGVNPLLDAEAIRVVSVLPPFQPGKQGGKPVPVWYMVPITFALGGEKDSSIPPPPPPPPPAPSGSAPYVTGAAKGENDTYVMVEEMPEYPGGNEEMLKFIAMNVRYPEAAKKAGITGKVIIRFKVTETGEVKEPSIFKGVEPSIDAEALRVVSLLPPFKPGTQGGKNVSVWIMVPITFSLK